MSHVRSSCHYRGALCCAALWTTYHSSGWYLNPLSSSETIPGIFELLCDFTWETHVCFVYASFSELSNSTLLTLNCCRCCGFFGKLMTKLTEDPLSALNRILKIPFRHNRRLTVHMMWPQVLNDVQDNNSLLCCGLRFPSVVFISSTLSGCVFFKHIIAYFSCFYKKQFWTADWKGLQTVLWQNQC